MWMLSTSGDSHGCATSEILVGWKVTEIQRRWKARTLWMPLPIASTINMIQMCSGAVKFNCRTNNEQHLTTANYADTQILSKCSGNFLYPHCGVFLRCVTLSLGNREEREVAWKMSLLMVKLLCFMFSAHTWNCNYWFNYLYIKGTFYTLCSLWSDWLTEGWGGPRATGWHPPNIGLPLVPARNLCLSFSTIFKS